MEDSNREAEGGVLTPTVHPQFPWVLLGVTIQLEWLLFRGILSVQCSPTIHQPSPWVMDVEWWKDGGVGQGGVCKCVS